MRAWRIACAAAGLACLAQAALAADTMLPVPAVVIYPGDLIRDATLADKVFSGAAALGSFVDRRSTLVGRVARRTLLPGQPIPLNAVEDPRLVTNGAQVRVVFSEDGLTIVTYGQALQPGSLGDVIRLRNPDSGLIISGTVQQDGSVRVNESS